MGLVIALIAAYESRLRIRFVTEPGRVTVADLYFNLPTLRKLTQLIEKTSEAIEQKNTAPSN